MGPLSGHLVIPRLDFKGATLKWKFERILQEVEDLDITNITSIFLIGLVLIFTKATVGLTPLQHASLLLSFVLGRLHAVYL
jgi:hypothetical protein